ncbi:MAG: ABC transporter ATP-binding protein [Bacteroidales bacterium]|nr:ABC transporter ATP-binding protein [Bacteroidales bacterium]
MSELSEIAIQVNNLSKAFKIYNRPSDLFLEILNGKPKHRLFWALQDISMNVYKGQVVGLLGRNGAGKSTLLKIISGTLDKTSGDVKTNGRISSILELGTGFSGEYTGRENIYLGGLMVGLSRAEIKAKEDWIIDFSELRDFIDQPFKTYSSGMQARLTFATAVCVDPDILIVDEALSVGDARFARKSFSIMEEFRKEGRTILLVSHNSNQVASFCDHALILENGRIFDAGDPARLRGVYYDLLFGKGNEHLAPDSYSEEVNVAEPLNAIAAIEPNELDHDFVPEYELEPEKINEEIGFCWQVDLSDLSVEGDSTENPQHSNYVLCENGKPIGKAHAGHENIRDTGKGLFSHWGNQLLFSSSDNSDPRTNGRQYSLKHVSVIDRFNEDIIPPERQTIRLAALKKLGLSRPFTDGENTRQTRYGNGKAEILDYGILDENGKRVRLLTSGKRYTVFSRTVFYEDVDSVSAGFTINNISGTELYGVNSHGKKRFLQNISKGHIVETRVDVSMWITNGIYFLTFAIADAEADQNVQFDMIYDALQFEVDIIPDIHSSSVVNLDEDFMMNSM